MPGLIGRFRIAAWLDSRRDGSAPGTVDSGSPTYADELARIESRLSREARFDYESPPVMLRRHTLDTLHEITLYRRWRPMPWWQRPRVAASLVAAGVVVVSALTAVIAFGPQGQSRSVAGAGIGAADSLASTSDRSAGDPGTAFERAGAPSRTASTGAPSQILYDLDALASDAKRAADYIASQITFGLRPGPSEPAGPPPIDSDGPRPQ